MTATATRGLLPALIPLCIAIAVGCAPYYLYRPEPVQVDPDTVPFVAVNRSVTLTNAQPATEPAKLGTIDGVTRHANLHDWTETAVHVMRTELAKRGMPASGVDSGEINLAIVHASLRTGFFTTRCHAELGVEARGSVELRFVGSAKSFESFAKACDVAVARAVGMALSHPKIVAYIEAGSTPLPGQDAGPLRPSSRSATDCEYSAHRLCKSRGHQDNDLERCVAELLYECVAGRGEQ